MNHLDLLYDIDEIIILCFCMHYLYEEIMNSNSFRIVKYDIKLHMT